MLNYSQLSVIFINHRSSFINQKCRDLSSKVSYNLSPKTLSVNFLDSRPRPVKTLYIPRDAPLVIKCQLYYCCHLILLQIINLQRLTTEENKTSEYFRNIIEENKIRTCMLKSLLFVIITLAILCSLIHNYHCSGLLLCTCIISSCFRSYCMFTTNSYLDQ